jgi:hypothetical protein
MDLLKLIALDEDDLKILSAHLQDAVLITQDMVFLPKERRFVAVLNRFNWQEAVDARAGNGADFERRQAALRFEKVSQAQFRNLSFDQPNDALELLAIDFDAGDAPSGSVTLFFAGGGAVRLHVDCIEAELRDLGPIWPTRTKPQHPDDTTEPLSRLDGNGAKTA